MRTEEDFVFLDFEGEPGRSIADRRAKQSALKDLACMVRSYSYAAYAALFAITTHAPDRRAPLEVWADTWQYWVAESFLGGYRTTARNASFVSQGDAWSKLFDAFLLDRALSELSHELDGRSDWVRIPLLGISRLVEQLD